MAQVIDAFGNEIYNAKKNVIQDRLTGQTITPDLKPIIPVSNAETSGKRVFGATTGSQYNANGDVVNTNEKKVIGSTGKQVVSTVGETTVGNTTGSGVDVAGLINSAMANYKNSMDASIAQYQADMNAKGIAYAEAAKNNRDALIQARLAQDIAAEEQNKGTVENQLKTETENINQDVYNAQENTRAEGVQRGIQYSQQQQALEQGVSIAGNNAISKARTARDTALNNIKIKIDALRSGASNELIASQGQADADKAQYGMTTAQNVFNRQNQVADNSFTAQNQVLMSQLNQSQQIELKKMDYAQQDKMAKLSLDQQKEMMNLEQTNKEKLFNMDTDRQKSFFDLNEASKEKFWKLDAGQQEKMLALDAVEKEKMFNMEAGLQKEMFKMDTARQKEMLKLSTGAQKEILKLTNEQQVKMFKMDVAAKTAFQKMDEAQQVKMLKLNAGVQEKMFGMQAGLQVKMFGMEQASKEHFFNLESAQQEKILGMEETNKENFLDLSTDAQIKIMNETKKANIAEMNAKVNSAKKQATADTFMTMLTKSPNFTLNPTYKASGLSTFVNEKLDPSQVTLLNTYLEKQGLTKEEQTKYLKGSFTPSFWDKLAGRDADQFMKDVAKILKTDTVKSKVIANKVDAISGKTKEQLRAENIDQLAKDLWK
jgi:hypothetical protein